MATLKKQEFVIEHPNREKAASKTTKAAVILLLLISAVLVAVITIGGWDATAGAQVVSLAYVAIYLIMAFYIARWNSGVLPVAAALAIIMLIFAAVAAPGWFDRDKSGFTDPAIASNLLGVLTIVVIPIQVLLIVAAMRGFAQKWSVEVERYPDGSSALATG
jgi:uncharacterized membrane protein